MAAPRRRKIGHRRRLEDEGEDEAGREALDLEDDSMTDGSIGTEDNDAAEDSDTSNVDEAASPKSPDARKAPNGSAEPSARQDAAPAKEVKSKPVTDTDLMLHGLSIADQAPPAQEMHFDDIAEPSTRPPSGPVVVSSASAIRPQSEQPGDRRRQEHEDYKRRRDEDPAFVPNRGAFFMHDHRHAGPAANGFRPFGRGRGRGGRGGIGGPYAPFNHMHQPADPTTTSPWTHDMHEAVAQPVPRRPRQMPHDPRPSNDMFIPTCEPNSTPINRTLSTEKHIGNAQVRVMLPDMKGPAVFSGIPVKQYTKLPDHRPPLRRDKPVRISLPERQPRFIYPAVDRSFIFIPRAMRPNQQRMRGGKARSGFGSVGGYSRRTSVFGGSYYGSMYSPSIALSRRSSIVHERDYMFSPTGSVISRAPMPVENPRPVVRLPPAPQLEMPMGGHFDPAGQIGMPPFPQETSITDLPQPQNHPLPQKPAFQENRPASIPMHQPRPQKNISVADIEPAALAQGPPAFQQAFHQQVPVQVANGGPKEMHTRQLSYPSQHSTGTPLSQIPERAIHAAPFQPHAFGQQPYYNNNNNPQAYAPQQQPGYYYPPGYSAPSMAPAAPAFVPAGQQGPPGGFVPQGQPGQPAAQGANQAPDANAHLVAQEVNGMVYYYNASQLPGGPQAPPAAGNYPSYSAPQGYQPSVMGMGGMVTPSPDGFYYPQTAPGMLYYSQ